MKGIKGYWRRPRRKLGKALKKLTLLLRVQPEAHYKPRFDYNGVIARAFDQNAAQADFARNLEKEIAFHIEKASSGSSASDSGPFARIPTPELAQARNPLKSAGFRVESDHFRIAKQLTRCRTPMQRIIEIILA